MSRGNAVEVQFWGSDLCLVSMYRDGNITNGSGVEWWDLAHPGSMHIVTREQVLLRWSIVTAEMSQVKDRQKSVIEKGGGAVMRRLLRRCCKAVASRVEICEKNYSRTVLAGGLESHIFVRRIWATMQHSMDFGARYSRSIFSFPYMRLQVECIPLYVLLGMRAVNTLVLAGSKSS